jgi:hypothetical protein
MARSISHVAFAIVAIVVHTPSSSLLAQAVFAPLPQDSQCQGTFLDLGRIQSLTDEDISTLVGNGFGGPDAAGFIARDVHQIIAHENSTCIAERHRLRSEIQGIPVYGGDFVVTMKSCSDASFDADRRRLLLGTNTLRGAEVSSIADVQGSMIMNVIVPTGYTRIRTEELVRQEMAARYSVSLDKVSSMELEVYPTIQGDYLAWIGTVLVEHTAGDPHLYQIFVNDVDLSLILQCEIGGLSERRQNMLRQKGEIHRRIQGEEKSKCQVCAEDGTDIVWSSNVTECEVQTLYLSNEKRKTLCVVGEKGHNKTIVYGPGIIPQYSWGGVYHCKSTTSCTFSPIPQCQDAINDIQWGAINFQKYLQKHLRVMGGLVKDRFNPVFPRAFAHYDIKFCNAFYNPNDNIVAFGDCDCEKWNPLVSTDVVVHEITHGLTSHSSKLMYFLQSGGLNEAYSDIMACAVEHSIGDALDTPDFLVGEAISDIALRNMEMPSLDGKSIDDFCQYEEGMNVHHSSGFLNKAFVKSVRACEQSCGFSREECVIVMADSFMYTNLETMSRIGSFKDVAKQTCRNVQEFFDVLAPETRCSPAEVQEAIRAGFAEVGAALDQNCNVEITCQKLSVFTQMKNLAVNLYELGKLIISSIISAMIGK